MGRLDAVLVDWGTTNARAWAVDGEGAVVGRNALPTGIRNVAPGGFPAALAALLAPWSETPERVPRILMSGMVGSRQGWREAAYCDCPAAFADLCELTPVPGLSAAAIVPGVCRGRDEGRADVLRGEEVQVVGAMRADPSAPAVLCLPGTHSKWVAWEDGRIVDFASAMTGEVFDVLRRHSLLGATMAEVAEPDEAAFARGLDVSCEAGGLLAHLFSVRAEALFCRLPPEAAASYLSGMLVGHEVRAMRELFCPEGPVRLVADGPLAARYARACAHLGLGAVETDAEAATLAGLMRILEETRP